MYARIRQDPIPNIRASGITHKVESESAASCIQPQFERSSTPEHIKKYRKSTNGQPGVIVVHPGLMEDAENIDRNRAFGKIVTASAPVS